MAEHGLQAFFCIAQKAFLFFQVIFDKINTQYWTFRVITPKITPVIVTSIILHTRHRDTLDMGIRYKHITQLFFIVTLVCATVVMTATQAQARPNPKYAALVMDADTGLILYSRYADKKLHPASLAKMMTLLLTFDALDNGTLRRRDRVFMSRNAASAVPSKLDLPPGSSIQVEEAIYALVTKSANDVAIALAERIGGTEENFARMMTRRAQELGMSRTRFKNASGLHHPHQVTTARDIAKLAQYLIHDKSKYYHYFSTKSFSFRGHNYHNHNRLMSYYDGMDGLKTGYIRASGFNLVASAKRGNRRLIGVVFGGRSSKTRNSHMQLILNRGFQKIDRIMIAQAKTPPMPAQKPQVQTARAGIKLASIAPASGVMTKPVLTAPPAQNTFKNAGIAPHHSTQFEKEIGEGDFDSEEIDRFRTGLLAISAMKSLKDMSFDEHSAYADNKIFGRDWSIQIGAFRNKNKIEQITGDVINKLPYLLSQSTPHVAPLRTAHGTIYRGRITGLSKDEASTACKALKECIMIAPR